MEELRSSSASNNNKLCFDIGHIYEAAEKIEPMKLNIISVVSRFYDPVGVFSPFTVRFKILLQELFDCRNKKPYTIPNLKNISCNGMVL